MGFFVLMEAMKSEVSKKKQNQQTTSQVLSYINIEIHDDFANRIKSNYPYNELSLKGFDLLNSQAGNLIISENQLKEINKIYTLFDEINKNILLTRELRYHGSAQHLQLGFGESKLELEELQKRCFIIAGDYVKKYYSATPKINGNK